MIKATQVLELAILPPAHQITRAVEAFALRKRISDKTFCGKVRPVQIAPRQTNTPEIEFTCDSGRRQVKIAIQYVSADTGDRLADSYLVTPIVLASPVGNINGRFGGAIKVVECHLR